MRNAEFNHPRLLDVYDAESPWSRDDDYFLALASERPGGHVLDLGCGTGRLALGLAAAGHAVTGIDPSGPALSVARSKPGADRVTWMQGVAETAPPHSFDLTLMTGHVSQFLLTSDEWHSALCAVRRALVPGGRLAFHAYDPSSRIWEQWNPRDSRRQVMLPGGMTVVIWTEATAVTDDTVSYSRYYRFSDGEQLRSDSSLRFWSEERLCESVRTASFSIERIHGGWNGEPVGMGDGELILVARR